MKLKTVIRIRTISHIMMTLNAIASGVGFFMVYGTIGKMDYNEEMKIVLTPAEDSALVSQLTLYIFLAITTCIAAYGLAKFVDFLDDAIEIRIARMKRREIERADAIEQYCAVR